MVYKKPTNKLICWFSNCPKICSNFSLNITCNSYVHINVIVIKMFKLVQMYRYIRYELQCANTCGLTVILWIKCTYLKGHKLSYLRKCYSQVRKSVNNKPQGSTNYFFTKDFSKYKVHQQCYKINWPILYTYLRK